MVVFHSFRAKTLRDSSTINQEKHLAFIATNIRRYLCGGKTFDRKRDSIMDGHEDFDEYGDDAAASRGAKKSLNHRRNLKIVKKRRLDNANILFVVDDTSTATTTFPATNDPGVHPRAGEQTICDMVAHDVDGRPWREYCWLSIVGGDVDAADGGGNYDDKKGREYNLEVGREARDLIAAKSPGGLTRLLVPVGGEYQTNGVNEILALFLRKTFESAPLVYRANPGMAYTKLSTLVALARTKPEETGYMIGKNFRMVVYCNDSGLDSETKDMMNLFLVNRLRTRNHVKTFPPMELKYTFDKRFVFQKDFHEYTLLHFTSELLAGVTEVEQRAEWNAIYIDAITSYGNHNGDGLQIYQRGNLLEGGLVAKVDEEEDNLLLPVLPGEDAALVETRKEHTFFLRVGERATHAVRNLENSELEVSVFRANGTVASWQALRGKSFHVEPYAEDLRTNECRMFGSVNAIGRAEFKHLYHVNTRLLPDGSYSVTPPDLNTRDCIQEYNLANRVIRTLKDTYDHMEWSAGGHANITLRIDMFVDTSVRPPKCYLNQVHVSPTCNAFIARANESGCRAAMLLTARSMKAYIGERYATWSA